LLDWGLCFSLLFLVLSSGLPGTYLLDSNRSSMLLPKFIITRDGHLRLGMVNQHKDLLLPDDDCIGGGYYQFDFTCNRMILDRASYDFGIPRWHLLETLKVPADYRGLRILYKYDDDFHEDFQVSDVLKIEYY